MAVMLETSLGDLVFDLYVDKCPNAARNFLKLCRMKYYNNCIFHTLEKDFIAQSGDPTNTGKGGQSIYTQIHGEKGRYFKDEIHDDLKHTKIGTLAMVNKGPDTNGSQFYITLRANIDFLDGKYTIFGELAEGLDVLERMNEAYCDKNNRPYRNIRIKHTHILDDPFDDLIKIEEEPASPPPARDDRSKILHSSQNKYAGLLGCESTLLPHLSSRPPAGRRRTMCWWPRMSRRSRRRSVPPRPPRPSPGRHDTTQPHSSIHSLLQ